MARTFLYIPIITMIFLLFVNCDSSQINELNNSNSGASPSLPDFINSDIPILITDANIITMENNQILKNYSILIENGSILKIDQEIDVNIPNNTKTINVQGAYILPGLFDMHAHINTANVTEYLAYGITTARNMWGYPRILEIKSQVENNEILGPTIFSASPGIDAPPPPWPLTQILENPSVADSLVLSLKNEGYDFLKVYHRLSRPVYDAVAAAANKYEIPFTGHINTSTSLEHALNSGIYSSEHLHGLANALTTSGIRNFASWTSIHNDRIEKYAALIAESETWICPTLTIQANTVGHLSNSDQKMAESNRYKVVKALYDAGVKLLIGTDAGINIVAPGKSLHTEMRKFVEAGITPYQTLRIATVDAARHLKEEKQLGTISEGKRANLLLLSKNPFDDIANTQHILGVAKAGNFYSVDFLRSD